MLDIDTQNELLQSGEATIHLRDDVLYFGARGWLLAAPTPATAIIPAETAEFLASFFERNPHRSADFRVLTAKPASFARPAPGDARDFMFQPLDGFRPVELSGSWLGSAHSGRRAIEKAAPSLFGANLVDLTAMWRSGDVQPIYDEGTSERTITQRRADKYLFRFTSPQGLLRMVCVPGPAWRALHRLGLQATIVSDQDHAGIPPVGLRHAENPDQLFGYMDQTVPGISISADDGRDLVYNPVHCSWATVEWVQEQMASKRDIHLGNYRNPTKPLTCLHDILVASKGRAASPPYALRYRAAVDVLRLRGFSEEAIEAWLEESLPGIYYAMAESVVKDLVGQVDQQVNYGRDGGSFHPRTFDTIKYVREKLWAWRDWFPYPAAANLCDNAAAVVSRTIDEVALLVERDQE